MKESPRLFFWSGMLVVFFLAQGCVGLVRYRDMNLQSQVKNPAILNLHNYESSNVTYYKQAEKLIRGTLLKNEGDEYGYYVLKYKNKRTVEDGSIFFWTVMLGSLFWGIPQLCGFPTDAQDFDLTAYLYIFDSNGKLVRKYDKTLSYRQRRGLYYGHNPTRNVEKKYSKLYEQIFDQARLEAEEINSLLLQSGAIKEENRKNAKANIEEFFNKQK